MFSRGQFVAVIGRSGCGKSTLLRLIAGVLAPTSGQVSVDGSRVAAPRRDVAMMSQRPALLPWRSVLDNVLLPHELSGGMQQRVSLCRALIQQPRVMLMDEPFSALDALSREELSLELQRLHKEFAATTVFVTHSIREAVLLADRVVVLSLHPGRVRRVIDIDIPQPRSLGPNSHLAEVSTIMAELHELLLTSQSQFR